MCHGLCARLGVWERASVLWFPHFVVIKCDGSRPKVSDMIPLKCKNVFLKNQIMIMCREYPMSPFCFPKGCLFYTHTNTTIMFKIWNLRCSTNVKWVKDCLVHRFPIDFYSLRGCLCSVSVIKLGMSLSWWQKYIVDASCLLPKC